MNADPRRPEKIQRFVPKTNNGTGQEDLTPDYMNILGQHQTTAKATEASDKVTDQSANAEPNLQIPRHFEDVQPRANELSVTTTNANVIPTSPQYGVAIIPNANATAVSVLDLTTETVTASTETVTDTTAKTLEDGKELHSTPSRNDRFKVVKIASLEPFKRGRWKCMDYVDEAPPASANRAPQSAGSIQIAGGPYMQTQSLPQHQIQQMLMQGGFTNGSQFFPNVAPQMMPQGQYFYPQVGAGNVQTQSLAQQVPGGIPAQFVASQPYFAAAGVVQNAGGFAIPPQAFQNVQYVPANLMPGQTAFVPTSQQTANFQQSQTYAGPPNVSPLVNGHNFTPQSEPQQQQQGTASLPSQSAKSVIVNSNIPQTQLNQQNLQNNMQAAQAAAAIHGQYQQNAYQPHQQQNQSQPVASAAALSAHSQTFDRGSASDVYANPQFAMSVNSLTALDNGDGTAVDAAAADSAGSESVGDDPARTNPVVNAIDNKIEQAMDLVKSHLMYTVREEVEVLKEKIAELMERIQQLETENNFLRSQIPKASQATPTAAPSQNGATIVNAGPNFGTSVAAVPSINQNVPSVVPQTSAPLTNPSHNPVVSNTQGHGAPSVEPHQ